MSIKPTNFIVPIFGMNEKNRIHELLGTGSFVGDHFRLITAAHIFRKWNGPIAIGIPPRQSGERHMRYFPAEITKKHTDIDIAILNVDGYRPEKPLLPAQDGEMLCNYPIICFEYSTTTIVAQDMIISPATRLGNVTRFVDLRNVYGKAGEDALELSFPTLLGASGAPILSNYKFELWGIVFANVNYHTLPAQTTTILDETNEILEETKFYLPQGLAVHVKHLRDIL